MDEPIIYGQTKGNEKKTMIKVESEKKREEIETVF